jgi:uncharacterized protein (DUF1015 family)
MRIRSFPALRPQPEKAHLIASLPYDVVKTEEARALAQGNPLSMLHIVRAEIDFEPGMDPHADAVYDRAVENFRKLINEGHLKREDRSCLYVYQQQMGAHTQKGIVALCHIDDYLQNRIKKHEKTRKDKEDDRTRLTGAMSANAGPVFLTYRDLASVDALVNEAVQGKALYDFVAHDGIRHTAWKVDAPEAIVKAFASVNAFYVADGHHRSASAARVGLERRAANPNHTGDEDYNWFLSVLFPASQLKILPYNRVVQHLNGHSPEAFLAAVQSTMQVSPCSGDQPAATGDCRMYLNGQWYQLSLDGQSQPDPVERLDVSRLQSLVLGPLLGVEDPRTASHIEFVGGIRGTAYLKDAVDRGEGAVAFSLYPVTIDQLMDIADADAIMPPKSTWFEPKLRSGLFIHTF